MKKIYNLLKGKTVNFTDHTGKVCGYTSNRLLIATESKPIFSFRQFDKGGAFVEDEFKDAKFRYCYANEIDVHKSNSDLSYL